MGSKKTKEFEEAVAQWRSDYAKLTNKIPERKAKFSVLSGLEVEPLYFPQDPADMAKYLEKLSFPGQYPYTRGVYASMYRNRVWTKRQLVGFGAPEDLNRRTRLLLAAGQTGTNVTASSVSMRGYDTDQMADELHRDYVGLYGTALDSLYDIEIALDGIPIERVSSNYSDQGPFVSIALHFSEAQKRGIPLSQVLGSTNHADCLSHWTSCHSFVLFPLEAHLRLSTDHLVWCTRNAGKWHPLTLTGQHHSQNGATPAQEVAFTLAAGIAYVEECLKAGLEVDDFAPRIGSFFDGQINIFEMAAKLRAARRVWAKIMQQRFGARAPHSWQLPMHVQTSGVELTRQVPLLNIARVALQALGAVLGGCNSLHADSWDEAICIPSEEAALIALMTQHVISEESGVADVIDPLGGSYYLEQLTDAMEAEITRIIDQIDSLGGMFKASKDGWVYREIAHSCQKDIEALRTKEKIVVGVNEYVQPDRARFDRCVIDSQSVTRQIERTRKLKKERDQGKAQAALDELRAIAEGTRAGNLFQGVIDAVQAYCTRGEVVRTLQQVFGKGVPVIS